MKKGLFQVPLGDVLMPRQESPTQEELDFGGVKIVSRIKFGTGSIEFRASGVTKTGMIRIRPGDLVLSGINAAKGAIAIYPRDSDQDAAATIHYASYVVNSEKADTKFLWWLLRSTEFKRILAHYLPGGIKTELKPKRLLPIPVPLPLLSEQQRIVAHLDAIESRLAQVQKLREESLTEGQALTISLHHHLSDKRIRRMNELLRVDEEHEPITADGSYPQVGIRSFGEGMFRKPPTLGSETTYRSFNTLRAGKLVMSQVKGWEGAVAVCPNDLDGWFASPEYRTFACREGRCDPAYLSHLVKTRWFHEHLASATRGVGARRERIRPEMLLGIEIPFPDLTGQRTALKTIEHMTEAKALSNQSDPLEEALLPSLLDRVFNG